MSFENALSSRLLRREGIQLGVVAAATAVALLFDVRVVGVIAGIVDVIFCAIAAIALIVAWRVSGPTWALLVYAVAIPVFAVLAVLNLQG
jgi:hypothetical protein